MLQPKIHKFDRILLTNTVSYGVIIIANTMLHTKAEILIETNYFFVKTF